ncbi:MAG: AAA family ATPase, partial [Ruminobacter sp.]|nr:AAA family ATPase [Ruminobacter sp.]
QNSFYDLVICKDEDPFVDKTDLIADLNKCLDKSQKKFKAVTRPRRFGKTVTAEMLRLYYSKDYNLEEVKEIFADLKIAQDPSFLEHLNKYTVIYLDMNDINSDYETYINPSSEHIIGVDSFVDFIQYFTIESLKENDTFKDVIEKSKFVSNVGLAKVVKILNKNLGEKFICIIDEWDLIFRNFIDDVELQKQFIELLNGLFKATEAGNCFSLVYMTGILPIKKYESHSLLNNFDEYNMLEPFDYAKYFGFTDEEVKELVKKYNTSLTYEDLKEWYDGYKLEGMEIYNPYSVFKAITKRRTFCYFNTTASNEDVDKIIDTNLYELYDDVQKLVDGQKVPFSSSKFENNITQIKSRDDVYCILVCLGYLACIDLPADYIKELDNYRKIAGNAIKKFNKLAFIPNKEIMTIFEQYTIDSETWKKTLESINKAKKITLSLLQMDEERVAKDFTEFYLSGFIAKNDRTREANLRLAFITFLKPYTENNYTVKPDESAGLGYADLVYYPLPFTNIKPNFPIIIEFKIDKNTDIALKQIKDRQYYEDCIPSYKDIILVAINYNSKAKKCECKITKYSDLEPNLK